MEPDSRWESPEGTGELPELDSLRRILRGPLGRAKHSPRKRGKIIDGKIMLVQRLCKSLADWEVFVSCGKHLSEEEDRVHRTRMRKFCACKSDTIRFDEC